MERGFQSLLLAGKYDIADGNFPPPVTSDEPYISSQAPKYLKSGLPSLNYPYGSVNEMLDGNCHGFMENSKWGSVEREENLNLNFTRLKAEPSTEELKFSTPTVVFGKLPELQSMELLNQGQNQEQNQQLNQQQNQEERRLKRKFSSISAATNQRMLESMLTNFQLAANYFTPAPLQSLCLPPSPAPPPVKLSSREQAYRYRQTLSDKARSLQKLLPWDKKMDMATIYEETFKYIQFLKAQITVLESMPVTSTFPSNFGSENPRYSNMYGDLGKLNRQKLLEVLVNSPSAQSILCTKGCCIYSLEQLISFNHMAEKNFISDY